MPNHNENNGEVKPHLDDNSFQLFARIFLFAGIILFLLVFSNNPDESHQKDYWTIWGTRGDFTAGMVGTIFGIAGIIYVYLSFKKQREANEMQVTAFNHEKVESRFFNLIELHRANIEELHYNYSSLSVHYDQSLPIFEKTKVEVSHRQVFQAIKRQFFDAVDELSIIFDNKRETEIYNLNYLKALKQNTTLSERGVDLVCYAKIDIIYLIVFFGVGSDGQKAILSLTNGKYNEDLLNQAVGLASLKPKVDSMYHEKWWQIMRLENSLDKFWEIHTKQNNPKFETRITEKLLLQVGDIITPFTFYYPPTYEKYYGGHQFRLGHYFRHLYQIVTFVHNHANLEATEKYQYIKHLRGQFSTDEQIVLFLNSVSQLGRIWEFEKKDFTSKPIEDQLITSYNMIKNIPLNEIKSDIKLSNFYPSIEYEAF